MVFSGRGVPSQGGTERRVLLTGGGAGGGGEDNPPQGPSSHSDPINDQIALILVRLQQDMTSVIERLNRLEQQNRQVDTVLRQMGRHSGESNSAIFSSPEHEVLMVSYCDQSMSVVRSPSSTICFKS